MKYCSVVEFEYGSGARGTVGLVGTDGVTVGASYLDEQNANARLIAASPDLLAALEGWAEWYRKVSVDHDDDMTYLNGAGWGDADKLAEQTRAAIAKSRGES